jgi:4a-hydroxytetrahydrobiopterin dehydratase
MSLKDKRCVPCEGGMPPLSADETAVMMKQVSGWTLHPPAGDAPAKLEKRFKWPDFVAALAFVNRLGAIAEEEQHHPDFSVHYNQVDVTLWTHAVGGLSENDFIVAAKIDAAEAARAAAGTG